MRTGTPYPAALAALALIAAVLPLAADPLAARVPADRAAVLIRGEELRQIGRASCRERV